MTSGEVRNWFETACGEMGYQKADEYASGHLHKEDADFKKIKKAVKNGVRDIGGWLGDEYFNDKNMQRDLIGDHIYGEPNKKEILEELQKDSTYRVVATEMLKRFEKP